MTKGNFPYSCFLVRIIFFQSISRNIYNIDEYIYEKYIFKLYNVASAPVAATRHALAKSNIIQGDWKFK